MKSSNLFRMLRRATLLLLIFTAGPALHAQTLINLNPSDSAASGATGINDSGEVAGAYLNAQVPAYLVYTYSPTSGYTVPTVGGGSFIVSPSAINNSGVVAGNAITSDFSNENGFYYANGQATFLSGSLTYAAANGINNSGIIVGSGTDANGASQLFYYQNGVMTVPTVTSTPGGQIQANTKGLAINDSGLIVGNTSGTSGPVAFTYNIATQALSFLPDLGGGTSFPAAINASGQVVGNSENASGQAEAFIYSDGTTTGLGELGDGLNSQANAINNAGTVVGNAQASDGSEVAFIYAPSTGMQVLNDLYASLLVSGVDGSADGFTALTVASGINNLGQIVGTGNYYDGTGLEQESFVLSPAGVLETQAAPEPGTWALMLGGVGALAFVRRMRRA